VFFLIPVTPDFLRIVLIPNLRSVHFNCLKQTLPWVVKAFNPVGFSSSPLEDISISVALHRTTLDETSVAEQFFWIPCRQLVKILAGGALPFLRKVKISLTVRDAEESSLHDFDRKIRESFAAVLARPGTVLGVSVVMTQRYKVLAEVEVRWLRMTDWSSWKKE